MPPGARPLGIHIHGVLACLSVLSCKMRRFTCLPEPRVSWARTAHVGAARAFPVQSTACKLAPVSRRVSCQVAWLRPTGQGHI